MTDGAKRPLPRCRRNEFNSCTNGHSRTAAQKWLRTEIIGKRLIQGDGAVFDMSTSIGQNTFVSWADCENLAQPPKERVLFVNVAADPVRIKRADGVVVSPPAYNLDTSARWESRDDFCIVRRA